MKNIEIIFMCISFINSLIAISVSVWSFRKTTSMRADIARLSVVRDSYSAFHELDKLLLNNWEQTHLFIPPDEYENTKHRISACIIKNSNLTEMEMKEFGMASAIFTIYEQTLYHHNQARRIGDINRIKFLSTMLDHFTGRLLRNPRLLHLWKTCRYHFEDETIEHYDKNVTNNKKKPLSVKPDKIGPFQHPTKSDHPA